MEKSYYNNKRLAISIMWIIIGIALLTLSVLEIVDSEFIGGFGGGAIAVGLLQLMRNIKYRTNSEYKNRVDIEAKDERNRYIQLKAWSWAGYVFVICSAIVSLVLYLTGNKEAGQIVSYCLCAELIFYYISFIIISRKYS